jgi:hypothetical protein
MAVPVSLTIVQQCAQQFGYAEISPADQRVGSFVEKPVL